MKKILQKVPIPLLGVSLASAALGNLLQSYSEGVRLLFGAISFFCLLLVLLKIFAFPEKVKEDMENPIMASVAPTGSMAIMLLAAYVKPLSASAGQIIWYAGVVLHLLLILYFTAKFLLHFDLKKVFASYYIVYVGIVVGSVTAPAFGKQQLGMLFFRFGLVSAFVLICIVSLRYLKFRELPPPAQPVICIYAAPFSLLVAGYLQSAETKSTELLTLIYTIASILFLFSLIQMLRLLFIRKLPFFPSYASFTFPFVITAIASKQLMGFLTKAELPVPTLMKFLVPVQTFIAAAAVLYVLFGFIRFLLQRPVTDHP